MPNDDELPSDEDVGDSRILRKVMPDNDVIPSENKESDVCTPPKCKVLYSQICLFEITGDNISLNKRKDQVLISVVLMSSRWHSSTESPTQV